MPSSEKVIRITLRLQDEMSKELQKSANGIKTFGDNLTRIGTQMTAAFTVPIVAAGAAGVNMAMDLDKAMRNIQSISKQTDEEIKGLSQTFVNMSRDATMTTDSALGLADAFYQIQGSGFAGADAMEILEVSTKAATAGLSTTETAARALTQVLNTYKLSVDQASFVSDIMFETVNRGVGSYEELASALSNVTGAAAAVGIPFHEVSAALATMSRNGLSFAEGSVALNMALSSLLNPTAELEKAVKELGFTSAEAMIDQLGFNQTIQRLREYAGDSESALNAMFGSVRGGRAVLALTGQNAKDFAEDIAAMNSAGGAAADAFAIQMQSFDAKWKNFQNTLGAAAIEIGNLLLPVLASLLDTIKPMVDWFIALDDTTQSWIIGILAVVAAIGPLLLILGQFAQALVAISTVAPIVTAAFTGMTISIKAFAIAAITALAPFLPIIIAVVAASLLLWAVATNFMGIRDIIVNAIYSMMGAIKQWIDAWGKALSQLPTIFMQLGFLIVEGIKRGVAQAGVAASQLGQIILTRLQTLGSQMYTLGQVVITSLIKGIASKAIDLLAYVFGLSKELTQMIKTALGISSPSKVMMGLGENVVQGFQKGIDNLGGLDVGVKANGRPVSSASPQLAMSGASGGGNIVNHWYLPPGSNEETYNYIEKRMARDSKRKGSRD